MSVRFPNSWVKFPHVSETFRFCSIKVFEIIRNISKYFLSLAFYSSKVSELTSYVSANFGNLTVYFTKISKLMSFISMLHNDTVILFWEKILNATVFSIRTFKIPFIERKQVSMNTELKIFWPTFMHAFSMCPSNNTNIRTMQN